jgi:Na+/melibiose symporter-like transporter
VSSSSPEKSIATRQLWLFAAAAVPPAMLNFPVAAYLPSYYAQHAGLSMATVGLVFMLARIFDFITDPIMGVLTDRTRSRWGARRPWVFISIPMLLASVWALFFPPNDIGVAWLVVSLFSMTAAATVLSITHNAWSADLAVGYNERSRVQAVIVMLTIGGALASMVLPAIFEAGAADPVVVRSQSLGLLLLVLTVPTVAMTLLSGAESPTPEAKGVGENPFKAIYAALRRQPYLARLLFADFAQGAAAGTLGALSLYVATAKGLADRASLLILCFYITALIAIPAWNRLSYRLGKRQTIGFASILSIVLFLSMTLVPSGNLVLGCIAFTILGIPASAWMFLMKSIVADCIEIEEKAVGQPRAGMIFSLFVLTQKLSAAIAVGLSFMMLSAIGFAPGAPMSESQAAYILGTVTAVCCFGHAVMAWVSFRGQSSQRIANEVATSS